MKKILALLIALCLVLTCSGCNNGGGGDKPVDPDPQPEVIDAEITMENFVKKLEAGNYVIDATIPETEAQYVTQRTMLRQQLSLLNRFISFITLI